MQQSLESERLQRIIDEKTVYYNRLFRQDPTNHYLSILNSEITFLRDIIMPIVLMNTTVLYSGLAHLVTASMRAVENSTLKDRIHAVAMYYEIKQPRINDIPVVAIAGNTNLDADRMFRAELFGQKAATIPVFPNQDDYLPALITEQMRRDYLLYQQKTQWLNGEIAPEDKVKAADFIKSANAFKEHYKSAM